MEALITDAVKWWTLARPDAPALHDGTRTVTYSELAEWSESVASHFVELGVKPGDTIAVIGKNSIEWCVAAMGAIISGAVIVGYSPSFTENETSQLLAQSTPKLVLADGGQLRKVGSLTATDPSIQVAPLTDLNNWRRTSRHTDRVAMKPDDPVAIVFTSGSTGTPKGITFTHRTILALVCEQALREPIAPEDFRFLTTVPMYTNGGVPHGLCMTIARGGCLFLMSDFDPERAVDMIVRHQITVCNGVTVIWERMAQIAGFETLDLSHVRLAMVGGSRVPPALLELWQDRGVSLRQLYGMTEVGGVATLPTRDGAIERPDCCGFGSPFTQVRIVDDTGEECPQGVVGEVIVRGPAVTPGYWRNPEATAELIRDGWVHSGDLAVVEPDGNIRFVDRAKDMVISGGFNISPMEIENALSQLDGIVEAAVISVDDDRWGECPAAIVYASKPLEQHEIIDQLTATLARYKLPRYIVTVDSPLPRLPNGKLAKRQLKDEYGDLPRRESVERKG